MTKEKMFYILELVIGIVLALAITIVACITNAWSATVVLMLIVDVFLIASGAMGLHLIKGEKR